MTSVHGFARLDLLDDRFAIVCLCGWRSIVSDSGEVVGTDFDHHLHEACDHSDR
jgi:hypothetical protein